MHGCGRVSDAEAHSRRCGGSARRQRERPAGGAIFDFDASSEGAFKESVALFEDKL
jgi:hypothetical protein